MKSPTNTLTEEPPLIANTIFLFILFTEEGYVRIYLRGRPVTSYVPTDHEGYSLTAKASLPTEKLKLDWVYP